MYKIFVVGKNEELECEQLLTIKLKSLKPFYTFKLDELDILFEQLFLRDTFGLDDLVSKVTFKYWTFRGEDE